jgi:glycosyltransferase involved in cell wall biosynthesis
VQQTIAARQAPFLDLATPPEDVPCEAFDHKGSMSLDASRPKATVMIITYNHVKYIAQAIESVLAQQTTFPFAIHVVDDCSTDGTSDVVRNYAARYPGVVKPFINKKNLGRKVTQRNFYYGWSTLDGDYACVLEGDDYWATTTRLQTHVDFLEANPDFAGCATHALKVYEDGSKDPEMFPPQAREIHDVRDLIMISSFFHASSLTFRNVFRGKVPRYLRSPLSCDIFITIAHAQFGKIRFFSDVGSVYRVHDGGLFSGMCKTKGWMWNIDGFVACNRWLGYRYFGTFARSIVNYCNLLLQNGVEADGLTPQKHRHYAAVRRRYRSLDKAFHRLDPWLAKWLPGWRPISSPARLNMGAGRRQPLKMINVDLRAESDPDVRVDLEKTPWIWPDDYAEEVQFEGSLEHMGADWRTFQAMMAELYRVCRPGARVRIAAKHPWSNSFVHDPTCVRVVSPGVMSAFDATAPLGGAPEPVAKKLGVDFEIVERTLNLAEPFRTQFATGQITLEAAAQMTETMMNVCTDYVMELRVHKPPRG